MKIVKKISYQLKLKLKSILKPIIIEVDSVAEAENILEKLSTSSSKLFKIGPICFNTYDLKYINYQIKRGFKIVWQNKKTN